MRIDGLLDALRNARLDGPEVRDWSICVSESRRLGLGVKDTQAGNVHAPLEITESCRGRYLLAWDDGLVSRGHFERRQIEEFPERAIAEARSAAYDDPDAARVLGPARFPDTEMHDPATAAMASGDTDLMAARLAEVRRRVDERGVRTWSGSFSTTESHSRIVTSAGLDETSRGTSTGWHVSLNGEIGDGFSARRPETAEQFSSRLDRLLRTNDRLERDANPLRGGMHSVVLHPRVVIQFVLGTFLHHLQGATIHHGKGRYSKDDFGSGRPVIREDIGLSVDPLLPFRSGAYRFTVEGVPAARCRYVDRGRLEHPIVDLKYAHRLDLPPTPAPHSGDTLVFEGAPERTSGLDRALKSTDSVCLVLAVLGVHTQDRTSGDFSLSAPQTLRFDDGDCAGRLRPTLSGNLFEVLRSDDLRFVRFEGEVVPGLLMRCRLDCQG